MKIYRNHVLLSKLKHTKEYLATVYLLSADKELWFRAKKALDGKSVLFELIDKTNLECYAYTLLSLAQDLYDSTHHISLHDIGDPYLISNKTCILMINAIHICRDGYAVLGINKHFN